MELNDISTGSNFFYFLYANVSFVIVRERCDTKASTKPKNAKILISCERSKI